MVKNIFSIIFSLFLVLPVAAQEAPLKAVREGLRQEVKDTRSDVRENVQNIRQEAKENVQQLRGEAKQAVQQKQTEIKERVQQQREAMKQNIQDRRVEFKTTLEAKRTEVKERIQTQRAELKERLAKIKDERKQKTVEKINQQIEELNDRQLKHFSDVLEKLEKVLEKIGTRTDRAEERGVDVAAVRAAIEAANTAIAASRSAIEVQAAKTYVIEITGEETLKMNVGKARQALHADLAAVRETVKAAHGAVKKTAVTLAQIPRIDEIEQESVEPTETQPTQ